MNWRDAARVHLYGDASFAARHTIRPPQIPTGNLPEASRKAGGLRLFDLGATPHPLSLAAVAICRGYFCREMGAEFSSCYEAERGFLLAGVDDGVRTVLGAIDVGSHPRGPVHLL